MTFNISIDSNNYSRNHRFKNSFGNSVGAMSSQPANDIVEAVSYPKGKKESFLSKHWGKMLIGAGGLAAVILLFGKNRNIWSRGVKNHIKDNNIGFFQEKFKQIFRRNFSKENSEQMLQKYKEIYQIEDKNEFIVKAFKQVKKDYGYETLDLELKTHDSPAQVGTTKASGAYYPDFIFISSNSEKENILGRLAHEFNHIRQDEYVYRLGHDIWVDATMQKSILRTSELEGTSSLSTRRLNDLKIEVNRLAGYMKNRFGYWPQFKEGTPEYIQAEKYLEEKKLNSPYVTDSYKNNLLEQESVSVGNLMREVAENIKKM
ncbi:MAG: hypothetical protein WCF95_05360 [bacterium]